MARPVLRILFALALLVGAGGVRGDDIGLVPPEQLKEHIPADMLDEEDAERFNRPTLSGPFAPLGLCRRTSMLTTQTMECGHRKGTKVTF